MAGIKDQENIDELRKRLYDRGHIQESLVRHKLTNEPIDVARGWAGMGGVVKPSAPLTTAANPAVVTNGASTEFTVPGQFRDANDVSVLVDEVNPTLLADQALPTKPKTGRFRIILLVSSMIIFILTALATSVYLYFGANQISASNINLAFSAPFSIAGGDVASLQLSLANQNSVAIENITIMLNYPSGTRSADETGRELFEERIPIASLGAGEAINLPLRVVLSGEENEDKTIKASIEYKVSGSDGLFFREAPPQVVRISSSPLVMRVISSERISSGQSLEVKLELRSNATTPQRNILVSASYPSTFSFERSTPGTSYAQNGWLIDQILPGQTYDITLVGKIQGLIDDSGEIQFSAGNPSTDNQFIMGAVLTQARFTYTIERPFTNIAVGINGDTDGATVVAAGQDADVIISIENTLTTALYGLRAEVAARGNLIRPGSIESTNGTYDASNQTITFNRTYNTTNQGVFLPGAIQPFGLTVKADPNQKTAAFDLVVNIYARRDSSNRAPEFLVGTALAEAKYTSALTISGQAGYNDGSFNDTGAVPPVANLPTKYTITLRAEGGSNDATGVVMTTNLPGHVNWQNLTSGDGAFEYNQEAKQVRWNVGDLTAFASKTAQFQVTLLPTPAQVGRTVILIDAADMRATDRFTNTPLRTSSLEITTELSTEAGFVSGNGIIQPSL